LIEQRKVVKINILDSKLKKKKKKKDISVCTAVNNYVIIRALSKRYFTNYLRGAII